MALVSPGKPADHLGAAADLDEGTFEQVRVADSFAVLGRPAQVRDVRVDIARSMTAIAHVGAAAVGDDRLRAAARIRR